MFSQVAVNIAFALSPSSIQPFVLSPSIQPFVLSVSKETAGLRTDLSKGEGKHPSRASG